MPEPPELIAGRLHGGLAGTPRRSACRCADRRLRDLLRRSTSPRTSRASSARRSRQRRPTAGRLPGSRCAAGSYGGGRRCGLRARAAHLAGGGACGRRASIRTETPSTGGCDHLARQRDAQARAQAARPAQASRRDGALRRRGRGPRRGGERRGHRAGAPARRRRDGGGGAARAGFDAAASGPGDRRVPPSRPADGARAARASPCGGCPTPGTSAPCSGRPMRSAPASRSRTAAPTRSRRRRYVPPRARSSARRSCAWDTRPRPLRRARRPRRRPAGRRRPHAAGHAAPRARNERACRTSS